MKANENCPKLLTVPKKLSELICEHEICKKKEKIILGSLK